MIIIIIITSKAYIVHVPTNNGLKALSIIQCTLTQKDRLLKVINSEDPILSTLYGKKKNAKAHSAARARNNTASSFDTNKKIVIKLRGFLPSRVLIRVTVVTFVSFSKTLLLHLSDWM